MLKSYWWKTVLAASFAAAAAWGGTFGTVVSIGGEASDLALDETRGVLYIANFTGNQIDVMSLATNTIQTSINVAAQPSSIALSPDDRFLVATNFGNTAAPGSPRQCADRDRSDQPRESRHSPSATRRWASPSEPTASRWWLPPRTSCFSIPPPAPRKSWHARQRGGQYLPVAHRQLPG
jgi:DNA-binding beta-propeller fold protein YncE